MNDIALATTASNLRPAPPARRRARTSPIAPRAYAVVITFAPQDSRTFTVHIRPKGQRTVPCRAYFSEGDLRTTLAQSFRPDAVDGIVLRARTTGLCDLRTTRLKLDIARAAALGWFGAVKHLAV